MIKLFSLIIVIAALPLGTHARPKLNVGQQAPALTVAKWIKGTPISKFAFGRYYAVELSATWCSPCRKVIPHLARLVDKYRTKVEFVSVYVLEDNNGNGNEGNLGYVKKVERLIDSLGSQINFAVAVDGPDRNTYKEWGGDGVPYVYIVDPDGRIAWIGNPLDLEPVLDAICAGEFNAVEAADNEAIFLRELEEISRQLNTGLPHGAVDRIDELIRVKPQAIYLYVLKYRALAQSDEFKAEMLLQWLVNADLPGFDWDRLVVEIIRSRCNSSFDWALSAADRAIERSETMSVAAMARAQKARLYVLQSSKRLDFAAARQDLANAIHELELAQRAIDPMSVDLNMGDLITTQLIETRFKWLSGEDDTQANLLVKQLLHRNFQHTDWESIVAHGMRRQQHPDFSLLLEVAERAIQTAGTGLASARPIALKGDVLVAAGDLTNALKVFEEAATIARSSRDSRFAEPYERALASFKQRHGL